MLPELHHATYCPVLFPVLLLAAPGAGVAVVWLLFQGLRWLLAVGVTALVRHTAVGVEARRRAPGV